MCNQAVGLIAGELERRGIATVALQLLREAAEAVRPPRSLLVPYPHGYPLGRPDAPEIQHEVIEVALSLFELEGLGPGTLSEYWEAGWQARHPG